MPYDAGIFYVQQRLRARGYDPGKLDGLWGDGTRKAFDAALPHLVDEAQTDAVLISQLKRDEGLRLRAYPDPLTGGAPWTIGYGHTGPEVHKGLLWSEDQCEAALLRDVQVHNATLARVLPWVADLDAPRRRVLQNMHFNLGWDNPRTPKLEGLAGFVNTLAACERGDYEATARGMETSLWARQVGARATRLCATMRTGVDA